MNNSTKELEDISTPYDVGTDKQNSWLMYWQNGDQKILSEWVY